MTLDLNDSSPSEPTGKPGAKLTFEDAVDIWIARWMRVRLKDLVARYRCDSRRLYEVWWEERFPGSRRSAAALFRVRYPHLADRTDYGYRRIPLKAKVAGLRQPTLFD